jgi:protein gp37
MGDNSHIEWTDATWNYIVGCSKVSPGCKFCYFMELHTRRHEAWKAGRWPDAPQQYHFPWTTIQKFAARLDVPLRWKRPRKIFVNSLSDLFHDEVSEETIAEMFGVMAMCQRHTFQILTKRPERMERVVKWLDVNRCMGAAIRVIGSDAFKYVCKSRDTSHCWPLPNVWLGVSVESQQYAVERIPHLLRTPAAKRFLSCEPLLGPLFIDDLVCVEGPGSEWHFSCLECDVDVRDDLAFRGATIDWVIAGGESGKGARPMHPDWVRSLRNQCEAADVHFFFKQWGEWSPTLNAKRAGKRVLSTVSRLGDGRDNAVMERVGKKRAGALLDGKEHRGIPLRTEEPVPRDGLELAAPDAARSAGK